MSLLRDRGRHFTYSNVGADGWTVDRYVNTGNDYWCTVSAATMYQTFVAQQAGSKLDVFITFRDEVPIGPNDLIVVDNVQYMINGIMPLTLRGMKKCKAQFADKTKLARTDARCTSIDLTPQSVNIPHGTGPNLGVIRLTPRDEFGLVLAGKMYGIVSTDFDKADLEFVGDSINITSHVVGVGLFTITCEDALITLTVHVT